jgi:hypothetical protein
MIRPPLSPMKLFGGGRAVVLSGQAAYFLV